MRKIAAYFLPLIFAMLAAASCRKPHEAGHDRPFEIEVSTPSAKADTLRLISYNILEGMKLDKANNYDNLVAWVNKMNPDILAFEEANKITQTMMEGLAKRWGHDYVVTNLKSDDNYPVALTSKYPIQVRDKIIENVSHGAIFATIKGINIVVLHLWPQPYARGGETGAWAADKNNDYDRDGDVDGDDYRLSEMKIFLDRTIRMYPKETKWLMMGDFNSRSPLDKPFYSTPMNYDVHNYILANNYIDTVREMHKEWLRSFPTVYSGYSGQLGGRIDYIYGTQVMIRDIVRATHIYDDFTDNYSDHYPVMLDFRIYE